MHSKYPTVEDLIRYSGTDPSRPYILKAILGYNNRQDFLLTLREIITLAFRNLECDSNTFNENALNEEHISMIVSKELKSHSLLVTLGENSGGETDLTIRDTYKTYKLICEAKIYKNSGYCYDGFEQLTTRYTTGAKNFDDFGALFIYVVKHINVKEKMELWEKDLKTLQEKNQDVQDILSTEWIDGSFNSVHQHYKSGENFTTWHIPLMLSFSPKDKSARRSKKHGTKNLN